MFVIDHGGSDDDISKSYICLWNGERLYDEELALMLKPFTSRLVNVNVVLGQCYAGGFNDNLEMVGCVVASAAQGNESSWACSDIPYDEFVYQWTCAVNGATHTGEPVVADGDRNGRVTMQEAFEYAELYDRQKNWETPQYTSTPLSVGEDLAFNHLAPSVDLFIQDNLGDTGKEPNTTIEEFWKSPSFGFVITPTVSMGIKTPCILPNILQLMFTSVFIIEAKKNLMEKTSGSLFIGQKPPLAFLRMCGKVARPMRMEN